MSLLHLLAATLVTSRPNRKRSRRVRININDLPPEVLLIIMEATMSTCSKDLDVYNTPRVPFNHGISHVCRRWRTIALSCADLWSVVPHPESLPQWTKLCLSRCAHGPIELYVPLAMSWATETAAQDAIRLVLPHLARVRRLDLHLGLDSYLLRHKERGLAMAFVKDIIEALTAQRMPSLEAVTLFFNTSLIDGGPYRGPTFPSNLFERQPVPRLRRLTLAYCVVSSSSPIYAPSLRHLELHNVRGWGGIDGMIQCLQNTPLLETFIYKDAGNHLALLPFDARRSIVHPLRCVRLDYLSRLELEGMFMSTAGIFSHLSIPVSATIHINKPNKRSDQDTDHLTMFTEALTDHFTAAHTDGARFTKVIVDEVKVTAHPEPNTTTAGEGLLGKFELGMLRIAHCDEIMTAFFRALLSIPIFRMAGALEVSDDFSKMYPELAKEFTPLILAQRSTSKCSPSSILS
ncbi:hypothetical protein PENSPDRAFT_759917 [Peniophora sp. CONT]|nr:hypothetical protein PENSPDRAFT_759917 [Peniophora sp. CONT]